MRVVQFCLIDFTKFIISIKILFKTNELVSTHCFSSLKVVISEEFWLFWASQTSYYQYYKAQAVRGGAEEDDIVEDIIMCLVVVVYYCSTYCKAVRVGGGGLWWTCAMKYYDEPRLVWTSLPITH
jgi:hypothetical protein